MILMIAITMVMNRWDLDRHCSNTEWRLLTWAFPTEIWTNPSVFTSIFTLPESNLVVAATKDVLVLVKGCLEKSEMNTSVLKKEIYQQPWQDTLRRLIPYV